MQKLICLLTALALAGMAGGQETRTEITTPAQASEDARPNRDAVPDAYAISTQFDRILVLRLKYQTDLLRGMESALKKEQVRNAVILSGIGSVRGYHYHTVSSRTFPSKNVFVKNPTAPADLASLNGYVINGRVHAHATFADPDKAFGGHLEPGTEVFTFAVITVGVLSDKTHLSKVDDKTYR